MRAFANLLADPDAEFPAVRPIRVMLVRSHAAPPCRLGLSADSQAALGLEQQQGQGQGQGQAQEQGAQGRHAGQGVARRTAGAAAGAARGRGGAVAAARIVTPEGLAGEVLPELRGSLTDR